MKDSKLIDSSIWLAYFFNGLHKDVIESEELLLLSVLSLFEIKKKLIKSKIEDSNIKKSMEFVRKRSIVLDTNNEIAENAVHFSLENNLPIVDALIYSTSVLNDSILYTRDNDFRGLKDVKVLGDS